MTEERRSPTRIDDEQHLADHLLIDQVRPLLIEFLEDQKRKRELWQKFRMSFVGAVAVLMVTGIGTALLWIGEQVVSSLHSGRHP